MSTRVAQAGLWEQRPPTCQFASTCCTNAAHLLVPVGLVLRRMLPAVRRIAQPQAAAGGSSAGDDVPFKSVEERLASIEAMLQQEAEAAKVARDGAQKSDFVHRLQWAIQHADIGQFEYSMRGYSEVYHSGALVREILTAALRGEGMWLPAQDYLQLCCLSKPYSFGRCTEEQEEQDTSLTWDQDTAFREALAAHIHGLTGIKPYIEEHYFIRDSLTAFLRWKVFCLEPRYKPQADE